ncbi:FmdB family zinc ribbon protein [Alicyclobacillus sendaiensis]|uniref:FmdB family zinc ribbon protein n=1 Tax=Alicyclobacillus sendaiensis TaxID=192387 RepID=UPI0009FAEE6C
MPTYRFACPTCGTFDRDLPMNEASSAVRCPYCGLMALRQFTPFYVGAASSAHRGARPMGAGSEPVCVVRERAPSDTVHRGHRHARASTGRPWQLGHVHG